MVAINLANYRFSHNDSHESAKACIKRMNNSQQISRTDFIALVGIEAVLQLEAELGRKAHSFYISEDGSLAYADIHAIHYVFKKCVTLSTKETSWD